MPPSSEYDIPLPTKIKLKETKAERAEQIYRREQRRAEREARRIARANGQYETSPPRRRETITPPRYGPRAGQAPLGDEDEDEDIPARDDQEEWAEKLQWMAQEEMGDPFAAGFHVRGWFPGSHGFPGFPLGFGQRIPRRHRHNNDHTQHAGTSRGAADQVRFERGGPVPDIGHMTDDEYAEWVRSGIRERQHRRDMEDMERRRRERRERDRKREREEFMEREKEEQRAAKRRRESAKAQEADKRAAENRTAENRKAERRGWRGRCAALMDGEIVSINLKFADIPWPVYTATVSDDVSVLITPDDITIDNVRTFLFALAADEANVDTMSVEDARKKVLRDAIRQFHPDRFFARVLPRVREADRDKVKEGVERTSRLINELMSQ